jgi:hypothetical protein
MRAGISGEIYGYGSGEPETIGHGIEEDAADYSLQYSDMTVRLIRPDGRSVWFERGKEIDMPDWVDE